MNSYIYSYYLLYMWFENQSKELRLKYKKLRIIKNVNNSINYHFNVIKDIIVINRKDNTYEIYFLNNIIEIIFFLRKGFMQIVTNKFINEISNDFDI